MPDGDRQRGPQGRRPRDQLARVGEPVEDLLRSVDGFEGPRAVTDEPLGRGEQEERIGEPGAARHVRQDVDRAAQLTQCTLRVTQPSRPLPAGQQQHGGGTDLSGSTARSTSVSRSSSGSACAPCPSTTRPG